MNTSSGHKYLFSQGDGEGKNKLLCATIYKDEEWQKRVEYCGTELTKASAELNGPLTIRDKAGVTKGTVLVTDSTIQVLSWQKGGTKEQPYLQFEILDLKDKWMARAMQDEGIQIGEGVLESARCSKGAEKNSEEILDMRGKSIGTSGGGCKSGMSVSNYSQSHKQKINQPTVQPERR